MEILVCVKQVPDDSVEIALDPKTGAPALDGVTPVVNAFDTYALEMAVRLKEAAGGEVTVLSIGDESVKNSLKNCLAVGADYAYLAADELSITNVAVFSSYRRCGAANQLMKALDAFAQEKNLYGITLEVRVSNNAAIALYEKNGNEKSGIRKGFYSKPKEDALIMWKYFQQ